MTQVVSNLLHNSTKYMRSGGLIRLAAHRDADHAVISVADSGIGIPPAMLTNIFEKFAQVDRAREKSAGGLGIGLALVKGLVERHGGTVEARSDGEGRGSEFVIRLPVVADVTVGGQSDEPVPASLTSMRRRILLADDNADAAEALATLLELHGHTVCTAQDGAQAVDIAASFRPEVVLLDISMPKVNGNEAARRIRARMTAQRPLIVALTGWGGQDDDTRDSDAPFDHYLVKPVDLVALASVLVSDSTRST